MPVVLHEEEIRGTGKRRIHYGTIYELDTGVKIYLARRHHREIFREGKSCISSAMKEEVAAWAIDEDLLIRLRVKGVSLVGVSELDTGDTWLAPIAVWFSPKTSKLKDFTGIGRGGSRQRYVPLQYLTLTKGVVELDEARLY